MTDPLLMAGLALTAFCAVGAFAVAMVPIFYPAAAHSLYFMQLFKLLLFIFSIGACAVLFKALG